MLESLLYLSTDCRNEKPFPKAKYCNGTFAVILKSALNEIEQENKGKNGINFVVLGNDSMSDTLYMYFSNSVRVKVCKIDGNSSVIKIQKAIAKKIETYQFHGIIK